MNTLKGILIMVAVFVACLILSISDPLRLNVEGVDGEGWKVALYFIPVFGFIVYKVFKK
jgi:hypothetical protein